MRHIVATPADGAGVLLLSRFYLCLQVWRLMHFLATHKIGWDVFDTFEIISHLSYLVHSNKNEKEKLCKS